MLRWLCYFTVSCTQYVHQERKGTWVSSLVFSSDAFGVIGVRGGLAATPSAIGSTPKDQVALLVAYQPEVLLLRVRDPSRGHHS